MSVPLFLLSSTKFIISLYIYNFVAKKCKNISVDSLTTMCFCGRIYI